MRRFVLDASALIVLIEKRAGADTVERLIRKARDGEIRLLMSIVNWGEAYQVFWRHHGMATADLTLHSIAQLPISFSDADRSQTILAASFRVRFSLPFADGYAAALASTHGARLLTTDSDFERVKSEIRLLRLI